jgi:hypothetical protein
MLFLTEVQTTSRAISDDPQSYLEVGELKTETPLYPYAPSISTTRVSR